MRPERRRSAGTGGAGEPAALPRLRGTAAILALTVAVHLATILYAVRGGLTVGEILGRTQGNLGFLLFYAVFVLAAAIHAPTA